jgi:hypothetical protein
MDFVTTRKDKSGRIISPRPFTLVSLEAKMRIVTNIRPFRVLFGIAAKGDSSWLPKTVTVDKLNFKQVSSRQSILKEDSYLNLFVEQVPLIDIFSSVPASLSCEDIRCAVSAQIKKNVFYVVEVHAETSSLAQILAEDGFRKVLALASFAYNARNMSTIWWSVNPRLKRKSPAMFNGVFAVADKADGQASVFRLTNLVLAADVEFAARDSGEKTKKLFRKILSIHQKTKNSTILDEKIMSVASALYEATISVEPEPRQLGLWRVLEAGLGGNGRVHSSIIDVLRNFYDPSNPANAVWALMGNYVADRRHVYVHEGDAILPDGNGSYDSAFNIYHEYIRHMLGMLLYLKKHEDKIRTLEQFHDYLDYYAQNNDKLKIASWIASTRKYQGRPKAKVKKNLVVAKTKNVP